MFAALVSADGGTAIIVVVRVVSQERKSVSERANTAYLSVACRILRYELDGPSWRI